MCAPPASVSPSGTDEASFIAFWLRQLTYERGNDCLSITHHLFACTKHRGHTFPILAEKADCLIKPTETRARQDGAVRRTAWSMPCLAGGATEMGDIACRSWDGMACPAQPLLQISEMQLSLPALSGLRVHLLSHLQPPHLFQRWEWMSILSPSCLRPSQ